MAELKVSGIDARLERQLQAVATRKGIPLQDAALALLRRGAESETLPAESEKRIGHALDEFFGDWSEEEAREFLQAVEIFEQVDESMWR